MAAAAEQLAGVIEDELGGDISLEKAAIVTSHPRVTRMLRARLGEYAGSATSHVVTLGVDYAAGRGRGTYIHRGRQATRVKLDARSCGDMTGLNDVLAQAKHSDCALREYFLV